MHTAPGTPGRILVWTLDNTRLRLIQKAKTHRTTLAEAAPSLGFKPIPITMFQKDSMAKFVTDICYMGPRTSFLQKLKGARIGLEVSVKIGIE